MPLQQILFKPKRGWVQFEYDKETGEPFSRDIDDDRNQFFELDGVVSEAHTSQVKLTKNPVEFGADISNHAITQPFKIIVKGVVTNSPFVKQLNNKIPGSPKLKNAIGTNLVGTFTGERIRSAYAGLVEMQRVRQPFTLFTGLLRYDNMVLTGLSSPNDIKNRLDLTLTFEEVILPNLNLTTQVGYKPSTTTMERDWFAAAVSLATIGVGIASLAGYNVVGELGGLQS